MTDETRRNQIQWPADRHQEVCRQQTILGHEIKAAGYQMRPELQARLAASIAAEEKARDEFNVAR